MTSEMDRGKRAIGCAQAIIFEQRSECSRHRTDVRIGHGDATTTDRFRQPAEIGTNDHASASDALKGDDAEWLCPSRWYRHNPMSRDKPRQIRAALDPCESHLWFEAKLP